MTHDDEREPCFACFGRFPPGDGPTHPYLHSSPGCWAAYGEVLAREYEDPALFAAAHRFTVDAYALQHPGDAADPRARRSVWLHLASLQAVFVHGFDTARASRLIAVLARPGFNPKPLGFRPAEAPRLTVETLRRAPLSDHARLAEAWAREAHAAWAPLHGDAAALIGPIG